MNIERMSMTGDKGMQRIERQSLSSLRDTQNGSSPYYSVVKKSLRCSQVRTYGPNLIGRRTFYYPTRIRISIGI